MNSAIEHRSSGVFHHGYSRSSEHSVLVILHDLEVHMASPPALGVARLPVAGQTGNRKSVIFQCQVIPGKSTLVSLALVAGYIRNMGTIGMD